MRLPILRAVLTALAFSSLVVLPCVAQKPAKGAGKEPAEEHPPAYLEALARYNECRKRLPFQHHTEGREKLASTRYGPALAILAQEYATAKTFPEESRRGRPNVV